MTYGIKTGGRQKGTPNKSTNAELRGLITAFLDENFEQVMIDLKALEPKDRVRFYLDLLQYGLPKLQSVQVVAERDDEGKPQVIVVSDQQTADALHTLFNAS